MPKKKGFITGITGQDGYYLSKLLLEKGYEVHGLKRHTSLPNTGRLEPILSEIYLHEADLTDTSAIFRLISEIAPDEIYNLAAQSDVYHSFESPEWTANVNALGVLRLLECIRILKMEKRIKFYQASTSELFGKVEDILQKESTPFYPRSPYAVAKLYGYWITRNYREAYGMFAANGILFNHESPLRGTHFVTRKITQALAKISLGLQERLYLGNLNAKRDWGHAEDAVEMQWLILQQETPDDYVIATGENHSVREFVTIAASYLGLDIKWVGKGLEERGVCQGKTIVAVDSKYFRPSEVEYLCGDARKAKERLNFRSKISFKKLVEEMIEEDVRRETLKKVYIESEIER
jgi:GDPmannose 4,6-dehydratase